MTKEELIEAVKELLEEYEPIELCEYFYDLYLKDKIEFTDLEFMVSLCGYEISQKYKRFIKDKEVYALIEEDEESIAETILREYFEQFHGIPPTRPIMASYADDIFQNLMIRAIKRRTPLTDDEIFSAYTNKVDVVKAKIYIKKTIGDDERRENDVRKRKYYYR